MVKHNIAQKYFKKQLQILYSWHFSVCSDRTVEHESTVLGAVYTFSGYSSDNQKWSAIPPFIIKGHSTQLPVRCV